MAIKRIISAASNNKQAIKTSTASLKAWQIVNRSASARAVHLYDLDNASVTVGTTVPTLTIDIPASGGNNSPYGMPPIGFLTALSLAAIAENTDTGTTAIGAGDLTITLFYT